MNISNKSTQKSDWISLLWVGLSPFQRALFWGVVGLKLGTSAFSGSHFSNELFLPFLDYFVKSGFSNPWEHFQTIRPEAFPYSGVMLAVLSLPFAIFSPFLGAEVVTPLSLLLLRLPMLVADFAIFGTLVKWFPTRIGRVLALYWCSPIVFYISYVHGQIDSIPTAFLVLALAACLRQEFLWGGLLYGLAIGSKFHVLAIAPFILLYLLKRPERIGSAYPAIRSFFGGTAVPLLVGVLPLAGNAAFRRMVFGEGESSAVFAYAFNITPEIKFYVCPAAVLMLLVKFFTFSKTNRDAFILYCGLVFTCLVLLLPPNPGWYFWSIPFIAYFYVQRRDASAVSYWTLSGAYLAYFLGRDILTRVGLVSDYQFVLSLGFTVMQSALAFVGVWIYRAGVRSNTVYKPAQRSLLIGIGGDSGTGKHTLGRNLTSFFGTNHVLQVNGDDYHKWPRGHESWKKVTHLNPQGNNLHLPLEHIRHLKKGNVVSKQQYDHSTGKFTEPTPVEPKKFNLFVGLHPFYLPRMRAALDLKIFMETDEEIRFAWKVGRDCKDRGYTPTQVKDQMEGRRKDGSRFIEPQKHFADLIIKYLPSSSAEALEAQLRKFDREEDLAIEYTLSSNVEMEPLLERLSLVPSLKIRWDYLEDLERQQIVIEGKIEPDELDKITSEVFPNLDEMTARRPVWEKDLKGINQLMSLVALSESLQTTRANA